MQDAVARGGKFLTLYKRPGQRVIINQYGDLIVRPGFAEASFQRVLFGGQADRPICMLLLPGCSTSRARLTCRIRVLSCSSHPRERRQQLQAARQSTGKLLQGMKANTSKGN